MIRKLLAIIVLVMIASLSIAGCTSSTSSNQGAGSASQAASTTANTKTSASASASATPSATPSAIPSNAPSPTVTPSDVYKVIVSGPTNTQYGLTWTAMVYKNGVPIPCGQLSDRIVWYINGLQSRGDDQTTWGGSQCTMTHDANGLAGSPFERTNVITATAFGVTSAPVYYADPEIGPFPTPVPTATPFPTPTPTPTPTPIR